MQPDDDYPMRFPFSNEWIDFVNRIPHPAVREHVAFDGNLEQAFESFLDDNFRKRPCAVCQEIMIQPPGKCCYGCRVVVEKKRIDLDRYEYTEGSWITR